MENWTSTFLQNVKKITLLLQRELFYNIRKLFYYNIVLHFIFSSSSDLKKQILVKFFEG